MSVLGLAMAGCWGDMKDQPRYEPYEASRFFPDGAASRPLVAGTVPRGSLGATDANGTLVGSPRVGAGMPAQITRPLLERGRQRYDIYCAPCHDRVGTGHGMIVQRGLLPPPSLHLQRLRDAPLEHFYDVITHGFGVMSSYAGPVSPSDRWAIAAYIRALQLSQNAPVSMLPAPERQQLEAVGGP